MPDPTPIHPIKTPVELGELVRTVRKAVGLTQGELAGSAGVGQRFVVDLEHGKPTCEIGKVLQVLQMLGIAVDARPPVR